MFIPEFWCGVIGTIIVEAVAFIVWTIAIVINSKHHDNDNC